ncbi:MAG: CBS and ACT domain-containing protein [Firmicutes bacterium]|nr:CBS and ACT domain-containing protein [Bacillota bacterium]MDD4694619.1 CBS and ACT domain-containing protein [Bacillota bacterium]
MFVNQIMSPNPITVSVDTGILEAANLMREKNIRRLPVVKDHKLVGIVTEMDILKVQPSQATTLSVFEVNYLLAKTKVSDVMTKKPLTILADATLEEAALVMRENEVGGLPVLDKGKLVGVVTESNIFDAFIDLMGLKRAGSRLTIEVNDRPGILAEIGDITAKHHVNVSSFAAYYPSNKTSVLVVRVDTTEVEKIVTDIEKLGHKITHVASYGPSK